MGIGLTSVVFSAAHYIGPWALPFDLATFTFRCVAGAYFALLFRYRGFGIAAGSHAAISSCRHVCVVIHYFDLARDQPSDIALSATRSSKFGRKIVRISSGRYQPI